MFSQCSPQRQKTDTKEDFFLCFLIRHDLIQPMTRATVSVNKSLICLRYVGFHHPLNICKCLQLLKCLQRSRCTEELDIDHLTGFKTGDWDQIFSVWQPGQYRPPVIKLLPVKHPARIDEFPLGRAELSLELPAQEGRILNPNKSWLTQVGLPAIATYATPKFIGFNGMEAG